MSGLPVCCPLICQAVVLGTGVGVPGTALGVMLKTKLGKLDPPGLALVVDVDVGVEEDESSPPHAATATRASARMATSASRLNMPSIVGSPSGHEQLS